MDKKDRARKAGETRPQNFSRPVSSSRSYQRRQRSLPTNFSKLVRIPQGEFPIQEPAAVANFSRPLQIFTGELSRRVPASPANFSRPFSGGNDLDYRRSISEPTRLVGSAYLLRRWTYWNFSRPLRNTSSRSRNDGDESEDTLVVSKTRRQSPRTGSLAVSISGSQSHLIDDTRVDAPEDVVVSQSLHTACAPFASATLMDTQHGGASLGEGHIESDVSTALVYIDEVKRRSIASMTSGEGSEPRCSLDNILEYYESDLARFLQLDVLPEGVDNSTTSDTEGRRRSFSRPPTLCISSRGSLRASINSPLGSPTAPRHSARLRYPRNDPRWRRSSWDVTSSNRLRSHRSAAAGTEFRDFAFDQPSKGGKLLKVGDGDEQMDSSPQRLGSKSPQLGPFDLDDRRRSWNSIVGQRAHGRNFSVASLPANVGRRISDTVEAIFGSERRQSVFAKMTEGVFAPTADEAAHYYHTPSVAAFDVDLEKGGEGQPEGPVDPARSLTKKELLYQRLFFGSIVFCLNVTCVVVAGTGHSGLWVLCVILFFKSKDFLSVWIQILCRLYYKIKPLFITPTVRKKAAWILSLIPAYSESEEQIVKTLFSLRDNGTGDHKQVMCVILDGKPRPIKSHMTSVVASFERPYVSLKWKIGKLTVDAGFVDDIPTLCIEKSPNAGKKDSLILCHDLFNYPRSNMDEGVRKLRNEIWTAILPQLTQIADFKGFDLVFCTDADSTIHQGALALLADACLEDPKAIAACGFVYVEYEPGLEWSMWNLYQQFQYSFGQIVRRGAEHYWGKVTCLPGCITMIVVRPEMAGAIEKYARPVTSFPVLRHQVQYLGTDRRLTYSMLSQAPYLHTLFVPEAGSETVAPQSLKHYLSQRRRWGSNAYFNNYFYFAGQNMIWITRIAACIEICRLTMVYYRVFNTALFLYGVAKNFDIIKLMPLIIISFTPSFWYLFACTFLNSHLRANGLKLFCGFCINRCISPFMSITVFSLVARNLGSQVWGISGVTVGSNVTPAVAAQVLAEEADGTTDANEEAPSPNQEEKEAEVEVMA